MDSENLKKLQQIYSHNIEVSEEELIRMLDTHAIETQAAYNRQDHRNEPITTEFINKFINEVGEKDDFVKISLIGHNHLGMQCIYFISKCESYSDKTIMPRGYKATLVQGNIYVESL